MAQSIHFSKLKYFSEEFTKDFQYSEILQKLKKILKEEEEIDETLENYFLEVIEIKQLTLSANISELGGFLKTGSKIQLHPKSSYYFVTEEVWTILKEEITKQFQDIKNSKDYSVLDLAEDYTEIKKYFNKKLLIFDAS